MITRQVKGIEDECSYEDIDTTSTDGVTTNARGAIDGLWIDYIHNHDQEPDIFSVSIGAKSFTFSIYIKGGLYAGDHEYRAVIYPKSNVTVDVQVGGGGYSGWLNYTHGATRIFQTPPSAQRYLSFVITDEQGNQFHFIPQSIEPKQKYKTFHPLTSTGDEGYFNVNSWVLAKVVTSSGAIITYEYEMETRKYTASRDQKIRESENFATSVHFFDGKMEVIDDPNNLELQYKRIKKITYPNGDIVTFNTDGIDRRDLLSGGKAINSISIENGYDATVHNKLTYKFIQAYFSHDHTEVPYPYPGYSLTPDDQFDLRLKLLGIDKIGRDNTTTEHYYKFGYVQDFYLPYRCSPSTDCYGYYNGKPRQDTIITSPSPPTLPATLLFRLGLANIPRHSFSFFASSSSLTTPTGFVTIEYGRDMTPDWTYAKANLLQTVTNGAGASLTFSYTNPGNISNAPDLSSTASSPVTTGYYDYDDVNNENGGAFGYPPSNYYPPADLEFSDATDGVCILKVKSNDGFNDDHNTETHFEFTNGMRFFAGGYFWTPDAFSDRYYGAPTWYGSTAYGDAATTVLIKTYQNSFVTPMDFVHGCNHGYSNAYVYTKGYNDELLSGTKYTFTNLIAQSDEMLDGLDHVGSSRLRLRYGKFTHTLDPKLFSKQYLGLAKKVETYSGGSLVGEVSNVYNEIQHVDSINVVQSFGYEYKDAGGPADPLHIPFGTITYPQFCKHHSNVELQRSVAKSYSGASYLETTTDYTYDHTDFENIIKIESANSKGEVVTQENTYWQSGNVTPYNTTYVRALKSKTKYIGTGSARRVASYLEINNLWDLSTTPVTPSPLNARKADKVLSLANSVPSTSISTILAKQYTKFDDHANILETKYNNGQSISSTIWDTRIGQKVAEVTNAAYDDIAYTSFEGTFAAMGAADYNKGNWDFDPGRIALSTGPGDVMTGRYYYILNSGAVVKAINPSVSGKKYLLSVWYRWSRPTVSGAFGVTLQDQLTVGDWTLATCYLTGNGSTVNISATGVSHVDELRLIPADAAMQTCTYEPMVGVNSQCDERNKITYFEYDAMGRLEVTRDVNRNIISLQKHVVRGNDN